MNNFRPCTTSESGSSLVAVLGMVTILTALAGTVMAVQLAQLRFIHSDGDTIQAQYTAEAGLYAAIDRLQKNPGWRPENEVLHLPDELAPAVSIQPFGGYLRMVASGKKGVRNVQIHTLLGTIPPKHFDAAVYVWGGESRLNVAGSTHIIGDMYTGERGMRTHAFKGKPFQGVIHGEIFRQKTTAPPSFDNAHILDELTRFDSLWTSPPSLDHSSSYQTDPSKTVFLSGDAFISAADSLALAQPAIWIVEKNLTVEGPIRAAAGSVFIAGERLHLANEVLGKELLLYGRMDINAEKFQAGSIQLLSRGPISITNQSYLQYPAFIFSTGEYADDSPRITIENKSTVDGLAMFYALTPVANDKAAHVFIQSGSIVRGAVYCSASTEIRGIIHGSLLTQNTYFYEKPAHYTNWLLDASIDVSQRPKPFNLPVGFGELDVISWQVQRDEVL